MTRSVKDIARELLDEVNGLSDYDAMNKLVNKIGLMDSLGDNLSVILDLAVEYCDDNTTNERRQKLFSVTIGLLEVLAD